MAAAIDILPSEMMTYILSCLGFKDLYRCKGVSWSWYKLIGCEFIIIEIFLLLPVKSLLLLRSASRYCYDLISDRDFEILHHTYQARLNPSVILVDEYYVNSVRLNSSYSIGESSSTSPATCNHDHYDVTEHSYSDDSQLSCGLIGSCHGLLCFDYIYSSSYSYVLYNPGTEAYSEVTPIPAMYIRRAGFGYDHRWAGFGYDHGDDDYKILALSSSAHVAHIYSFRRNSWRETKTYPPPRTDVQPYWTGRNWAPRLIYLNDALYWNVGDYRIVKFELANETFHLYPMPPEVPPPLPIRLQPNRSSLRNLCILSAPGGSYLHLQYHQPKLGSIHLWILKECGEKYSWERLFNFTDKRFDYTATCRWFFNPLPLAYLKRGSQILLVSTYRLDEEVSSLSYDFKTKKLEKTQIFDSVPTYSQTHCVDVAMVEWAESLFSIRMTNINDFGGDEKDQQDDDLT